MIIRVNFTKLLMFFSILVFVFYSMFYQYVVGSVDGILTVLGALMLILSAISTARDVKKLAKMGWLFGFIAISLFSGFAFSVAGGWDLFADYAMKTIKYFIVLYCIYCYIGKDRKKLTSVMLVVWISAFMLAISMFFKGEESTYYGGMSVGELNKNMLSYYITIGAFANIYLVMETTKTWKKVLLLCSFAIAVIAQLYVASRAGVISILMLALAFIHIIYSIKYEKKSIHKAAVISIVSIAFIVIAFNFADLIEEFVVFQRFGGQYTTGDAGRTYYQSVAWDIFTDNPLFGKGYGSVNVLSGDHSHSFYFEVLASIGLVGLLVLVVPLAKYMISFFKVSRPQSVCLENRMLARLMSCSILLFFITGVAQTYIYYAIFYIYIAIWISAYNVISGEKETAVAVESSKP